MVTIQLEYQGDLHCSAVHEPSGTEITTDGKDLLILSSRDILAKVTK